MIKIEVTSDHAGEGKSAVIQAIIQGLRAQGVQVGLYSIEQSAGRSPAKLAEILKTVGRVVLHENHRTSPAAERRLVAQFDPTAEGEAK